LAVDLAHSMVPIVLCGSLEVAALRRRVRAAAVGELLEGLGDSMVFFNEPSPAAS